jgi:hypothetical protein
MAEEKPTEGGNVENRLPHFYRKPDGGYVRPIFKREGLEKLAAAIPVHGDGTGQSYGLALAILEYCFGFKWAERHILDEPKNGFLGRPLGTEEGGNIVMHRVRDLAELAINLMSVRGVESPLEQIANGEIESGYAELEAGKLLLRREIPFRFIWPSGVAGESFDLEITFPNGRLVCADTKCKIETSDFSENGVLNTLNDARKRNLPKGYPGAVILKIPQTWHEDDAIMTKVGDACRRFLRGTKRIVAVEVYSSMVAIRDGIIQDWMKGTEFRNEDHEFDPSLNWRLLTISSEPIPNPPIWWRIADFYPVIPNVRES